MIEEDYDYVDNFDCPEDVDLDELAREAGLDRDGVEEIINLNRMGHNVNEINYITDFSVDQITYALNSLNLNLRGNGD